MRFSGVIPAVVTPFTADGELDLDALAGNVEWWLDGGVTGIVATGTMGEAPSLTRAERSTVVEAIVSAAAGRVPITVGVSAVDPDTVGAYAADAEANGAQALMVLPPLLYEGDRREIVRFYSAVTERTDLPIMLYNNPKASGGHDLSPSTIVAVAEEVEQVVAVKECSGDARRIAALVGHEGLDVLVGGDDWALEGFFAGADGWVSGVANVAPRECTELFERCTAGDVAAARTLYQAMLPLCRLDMTPKLVQYFKAGMTARGLGAGPCRAPRLPLTEEEHAELLLALDRLAEISEPV